MKNEGTPSLPMPRRAFLAPVFLACAGVASLLAVPVLRADQVEMQNGDRYAGTVLSMDASTVVLRSELLGRISLPRKQVAVISLGVAGTNTARLRPAGTNLLPRRVTAGVAKTNAELAAILRQLNSDTNAVRQVQTEILTGASPEANQKFNQLLGDLSTGKMTMGDLRAQAKAVADAARAQRAEAGSELGGLLDSYLAILDDFLEQTAPEGNAATNKPARRPEPRGVRAK